MQYAFVGFARISKINVFEFNRTVFNFKYGRRGFGQSCFFTQYFAYSVHTAFGKRDKVKTHRHHNYAVQDLHCIKYKRLKVFGLDCAENISDNHIRTYGKNNYYGCKHNEVYAGHQKRENFFGFYRVYVNVLRSVLHFVNFFIFADV